MKLTVLGGGGVRAPFLAKSLVYNARELEIDEIVFMDNDKEKLEIFGGLAGKIAQAIDPAITFRLTTDAEAAVTEADYVITTLRVGQDEGRYIDEKIAQKYGIIGQETTGVGGFAMALRSIPTLIDYCHLIKKRAKTEAKIFNFTNPSGLVSQALRNEGFDHVYGICDGPSHFIEELEHILGVSHNEFDITCYGLNHLSYFRDAKVKGNPVMEKLLQHEKLYSDTKMKIFDKELVALFDNELFNPYLYFFYYNDKIIHAIKTTGHARGEVIRDINKRMLTEIKAVDPSHTEKIFAIFIQHLYEREASYFAIEAGQQLNETLKLPTFDEFVQTEDKGGYAAIALTIIRGVTGKADVTMPVLVPNHGCIKELEADDVIEITCDITKGKITPRKIENIPAMQIQLIKTIKLFERLAVAAIKEKNKQKAMKALMVHPLVNSYPIAKQIVDEYLEVYQAYVGEWK